jgi:alginate O-acetyltransferase complex protein AlgJ
MSFKSIYLQILDILYMESDMQNSKISRRSLRILVFCGFSILARTTAAAAAAIKGTVIGTSGWLFLIWDIPKPTDPGLTSQVSNTIIAAANILKVSGIDLVVVLTPSKSRMYKEFLPEDFAWPIHADKRYADAVERLRAGGVKVPDLLQYFIKLKQDQPTSKLWFKCDTHWTAWAAEEAAKKVAELIVNATQLPKKNGVGTKLAPAATRMHARSDLSMVLPPDIRSSYPDEEYLIRAPIAETAAPKLILDDAAEVVVVGSSYMQPKYNFAPMLSNQLSVPVELHWKVHNFGPYKTMQTYLQSLQYKKRRPKLIIWSFIESDMDILSDNKLSWAENAISAKDFLLNIRKEISF